MVSRQNACRCALRAALDAVHPAHQWHLHSPARAGQGIQTAAWTSPEGLRIFLAFVSDEVLCLIGFSALGMLIAVLTRSIVAAIGISLAYILVFEGIIGVVAPQVTHWFPGRVFNTIVGATVPMVGPTPTQGYLAALLASVLYTVGFVVVSAIVFPYQDVHA